MKNLNFSHIQKKLTVSTMGMVLTSLATNALSHDLESETFVIRTGQYGNIESLQIKGDAFPTNYVMNATNSPDQDTDDHQWFGELLFEYRIGDGDWQKASTNASGDVRTESIENSKVVIHYADSQHENGIHGFSLSNQYALVDDYFSWQFTLTNTSDAPIEFGDIGVPLALNENWRGKIYEERVLKHSFVGRDGSYLYALRPSGIGPFLLFIPDINTGSGFEYQYVWNPFEERESMWSRYNLNGFWGGTYDGLNVFYIHSKRISERIDNGYIGSTSMILQPGESKTYHYKMFRANDEQAMRDRIYDEGLIDVHVVPGMIVTNDQQVKVDLHTKAPIHALNPQYPEQTNVQFERVKDGHHHIFNFYFDKLGKNNVEIEFGDGKTTVLQFYVIENTAKLMEQRADFIVEKQQANDSTKPWYKVFDEYLMEEKKQRGSFGRYWGWGDDWGFPAGEFLAIKNSIQPDADQAKALNDYAEIFLWESHMRDHHEDYGVNNFWQNPDDQPPGYDTSVLKNHAWLYRAYSYVHVSNTYFYLYKLSKNYPNLIEYSQDPKTYLQRAGGVMNAMHNAQFEFFSYFSDTLGESLGKQWIWYSLSGLMGESILPDLLGALREEGFDELVTDIEKTLFDDKYATFKENPYPYGSEYNFDNTGEEAVYTIAKIYNDFDMMKAAEEKTRACRSIAPVWYQYAAPISNNGEMYWNFQYTVSLAGYIMDDWARHYSTTPEEDIRMAYATKQASFVLVNSGQINEDPETIGAASWTYQAQKGSRNIFDVEPLSNGFRTRSGEADLGLYGALRILSSDVAIDPIFGLYCYGCDVQDWGQSYSIQPNDGVFQRLNLISEKRSVVLDQDRYNYANIHKDGSEVTLVIQNETPLQAHTNRMTFTNLATGDYIVLKNGQPVSEFTTTDNATVSLDIPISEGLISTVTIKQKPDTENASFHYMIH